MAAPAESAARGGAIGHVGGWRGAGPLHGLRAPFPHLRRFPSGPFHLVAPARGLRAAAFRHRRTLSAYGYYGSVVPVTYGDDGTFYGSYYDPSDWVGSLGAPFYKDPPGRAAPPAPAAPLSERPAPVAADRGSCRSETVAVASPGTVEPNITITRC
ncbi:MAG TPA: hypothetical protein VEK73_01885 [Xanthobacteraceae bacterium]|nr:hypothetical protein [Xanthobacteraceae bacterium]